MPASGSLMRRLYRGETDFEFIGQRKKWYLASGILIAICVLAMVFRGFLFGIEFSGGDQYQINNPLINGAAPVANKPGLKTYHTEHGNQNFYSTPFVDNGSGEQVPQRLALIDQFLATTTNPAAIQALQQARANLAGNQPGK